MTGNLQMTRFFWAADETLSDISASDSRQVFDSLEDEYGISINRLALLSEEALKDLYERFVLGTTKI